MNAVALLETIALQAATEHADQTELEEHARRLEIERSPQRGAMRARLLGDLERADELLSPLRRLLTGA